MDAIIKIARRRNLWVIEDACQGVGGGYEGRKFGSIGHVGAFSFNCYKNMTAGEGGVATYDERLAKRARCAIDPCHFYWTGRENDLKPFAGKTGRHTYTEWDQVLMGEGAAHPAMNPYNHPDNAGCRRQHDKDMRARSLEILNRTVMIPMHLSHSAEETVAIVRNIEVASRVALGALRAEDATLMRTSELDAQKFDMQPIKQADLAAPVA